MRTVLRLLFCTSLLAAPARSLAFSVLAHQAVVDAAWESSLVPELRRRFPQTSPDDLEKARAYAYGGSHIADLGYFPLSDRLFTDIVHYVRTGDFITTLIASAQTVDEYAFALGAAAHYVADETGHPAATNRAVAEIYPKLRKKYGDSVTYADDHGAHLTTEFRFDVLEMSRSKRSRDLFQHSLQFKVAQRVLDEAFRKTYGLGLDDLFESPDVAIATYRFAFRGLIHEATGIAWELYRADIERLDAAATPETFVYDVSRADFEKEFGKAYRQPGYFAKTIAWLVKLIPNKGPFKRAVFTPLPPHVRELFVDGLTHSIARYRALVAGVHAHDLDLANVNLDTGRAIRSGDYQPADDAYAQLLEKLDKHDFATVPPALRADVMRFYGGPNGAAAPRSRKARAKLEKLRSESAARGS